MNAHQIRRNVSLYKLFVIFNEPLLWGPVVISSIQQLGHMPLADVYFMESSVMVLCVLLDIPSGALADQIGRKKALIIGRLLLLASTIGFAFMTSPLTAWLANAVWAIGYSFQSNADTSLIYDSLKSVKAEKEFKRIQGCAVGSRYLLIGICSLAVGPLAAMNMRIPALLCIPFAFIPLVVAFLFTEAAPTQRYDVRKQVALIKEGVMFAIRKPEVRWITAFYALIGGASKIWFFTYNPYFEVVGIDLKFYGVIFALLNLVAWLSSRYAHRIEQTLGERMCIIVMIACIAGPILLMGLVPIWPMAYLVLCQNIVRGLINPFKEDYANRHIEHDHMRTTVRSVQSSTCSAISIATLSLFGLMTAHMSLLHSLVILGALVLTLGLASYRSYTKLF